MNTITECGSVDCNENGKHKFDDGFHYCDLCHDSLKDEQTVFDKSEHEWEKFVERGYL